MTNNYKEFFKSSMDWANVFVRTSNFPLDRSSIFGSYEDALKYAKGDGSDERQLGRTSYVGQIIAVYENKKARIYKIIGEDIFDENTKTSTPKNRGLEELISRTDSEDLIADSEIKAEQVVTDEQITIIGSPLGKLINPNNSLDVKIDINNNLQDILKELLYKELYPEQVLFTEGTIQSSVKTPKYSTDYSNNVTLEVGTQITIGEITVENPTCITSDRKLENIEYGYSYSNNNKQEVNEVAIIKPSANNYVTEGDYILTQTFSGFTNVDDNEINVNNLSECKIQPKNTFVNEGANSMKVIYTSPKMAAVFPAIQKIYCCSNVHNTNENYSYEYPIATIESNTPSSTSIFTVVGAWYLYAGGVSKTFTPSSQNIRNLSKQNLTKKGTITITSSSSCEWVVIAYPASWGVLKSVKDNGSNTFITENFLANQGSVNVNGATNIYTKSYKYYIYQPDANLAKGYNYTITIS